MNRRRLLSLGAVAALLASAGAGLAFRRTTDENSQVCLWWATRRINYVVNDFTAHPALNVCGMPSSASFYQPVENSFATWTQATKTGETQRCTDLVLRYGGSTSSILVGSDSQNLVVVRQGSCSDTSIVPSNNLCWDVQPAPDCDNEYNCWAYGSNIIALTTVTYRPATGEIVDADMELNGWNGESSGSSTGFYFTCQDTKTVNCSTNGQTNCTAYDVQNTVTHEAGHFLGLAHPCEMATDPRCSDHSEISAGLTMYPTAPLGDIGKRALEADDIDGVCTIYPTGQKTANCLDGPCPSPCVPPSRGDGGCSQGPGGLTSLLGVLGLLALRRRQ